MWKWFTYLWDVFHYIWQTAWRQNWGKSATVSFKLDCRKSQFFALSSVKKHQFPISDKTIAIHTLVITKPTQIHPPCLLKGFWLVQLYSWYSSGEVFKIYLQLFTHEMPAVSQGHCKCLQRLLASVVIVVHYVVHRTECCITNHAHLVKVSASWKNKKSFLPAESIRLSVFDYCLSCTPGCGSRENAVLNIMWSF